MDKDEKRELILYVLDKLDYNPLANLTVKEVAKDLNIGLSKAYELFNSTDFPSIEFGKTKIVMILSYYLWKLEKHHNLK